VFHCTVCQCTTSLLKRFVRFLLQQAMGRMLFWGQQGVSPDIQTAVKHYERGAIKLNDPVSMYDYAILILKVIHGLHGNLLSCIFSSICIVKSTYLFL